MAGYYDRLGGFLDMMVEEQFLRGSHREMLLSNSDPDALIEALLSVEMPQIEKWF